MALIPLTQGYEALVDDEDVERLSQYKWRILKRRSSDNTGYAVTSRSPNIVRMHRFLMDAPEGLEVDHINNNPLDNRKENLRLATRSQNAANRAAFGYYKYGNKWRAFAAGYSLGYFDSEEDAKRAYDETKVRIYGIFAWQNLS